MVVGIIAETVGTTTINLAPESHGSLDTTLVAVLLELTILGQLLALPATIPATNALPIHHQHVHNAHLPTKDIKAVVVACATTVI